MGIDVAIDAPRPAWPTVAISFWSLLVAVAFIWVPGYWVDEAVTVLLARRGWQDLVATLWGADAVHGSYYAAMRAWCSLFGYGELATRIPSAMAVAATSLVLMELGQRLFSRRVGILAGVVYPLIPATVWAAGEARSFALTGLLSTLSILALLRAIERPTAWHRWALVTLSVTVAGWLFIFTVLMLPAVLLLVPGEEWRQHWPRIASAAAAGLIATLPIVWLAVAQRGQVSWIPDRSIPVMLDSLITDPYFRGQGKFAAVIWSLLVGGLAIAWFRHPPCRRPIASLVGCLALPTVVLALTGPILGQSLYHPRYLLFTAPALALLLASVLSLLPRFWMSGLAIALLAVGAVAPLEFRLDPLSKSSWLFMVETLSAPVEPGDAMVAFSLHTTMARVAYPDPLATLPLLNEIVDPARLPTRLATTIGGPLLEVAVPNDVDRIWYMSDVMSDNLDPAADLELLAEQGFTETWRSDTRGVDALTIHRLERTG